MWVVVVLAAVAVVVGLLAWRLDPNLRLRRQVAAREPLPDADLAAHYFATDELAPELPAQVRRVLAKHTGLPAERLWPDDDLTFAWVVDVLVVLADLEEVFGIAITDAEAERTLCTIRAVSLLVAGKTAEPLS